MRCVHLLSGVGATRSILARREGLETMNDLIEDRENGLTGNRC